MSSEEFVEFYTAQKDRCLRAAVASGIEPSRAEEAVAEAFARAWSRWRFVRSMEHPTAWVVQTAINQNISWWRKRRGEVFADPVDAASSTDEVGRMDLTAAIRRLPPRQREAVVLRYLLDLDTQSAARIMGLAPGTVGAHLHHALTTLRAQLAINEGTPS